MTPEASRLAEHRALARRSTHEVFNEQHDDAIDEYLAADVVQHDPTLPMEVASSDAFGEAVSAIHAAFPDFEATLENVVAGDDWVVTRTRERGTHEGAFAGVEPTGTSVDVWALDESRIGDGELAETWIQVDTLGLVQQLGVVDPQCGWTRLPTTANR